jgi:hypothetical protein
MSFGVVAALGSAAIGAYSSSKASKTAAKSAERGQDILAQSREQGRSDVMNQFPIAQQSQTKGFEEFRDFLTNQVVPQQTRPFIGGNMAAQEQISRGLPQIQNAILGNPIDTSGFTARQIGQAPTFDVSKFGPQEPAAAPVAAPFDFTNFNLGSFGSGGSGTFNPYARTSSGNRFENMNVKVADFR